MWSGGMQRLKVSTKNMQDSNFVIASKMFSKMFPNTSRTDFFYRFGETLVKTSKLFFASKIFLLKIRISGENEFFAVFRNLRHFFKTVNTLENKKGLIKVLQQSVKTHLSWKNSKIATNVTSCWMAQWCLSICQIQGSNPEPEKLPPAWQGLR